MLWLLKLTEVSKTVASGYPAHWSSMALNTIVPHSHCINGGGHVAAWLGTPSSVFSQHPVLPPKEKKASGEGCYWGLICWDHVGVTLSPHLFLSQEQWGLSCSVSSRSSTRLVSEGGQSWVTAAQQPWPRVLFVLPPCKPSSSHLTAAGANSTAKQQLSNTEPFREPAYMHHCFHACHCLMQPGFLLSHPCAPQCGITLHIWIVEILLFILRIQESVREICVSLEKIIIVHS